MSEQPMNNQHRSGRYRISAGLPLDPNEGVHPEMREDAAGAQPLMAVPASPAELLALQENGPIAAPQLSGSEQFEKSEFRPDGRVADLLRQVDALELRPHETQILAYHLLLRLEVFHDRMVEELIDDQNGCHVQIARWAVDAERLMQARILLGNVDLE